MRSNIALSAAARLERSDEDGMPSDWEPPQPARVAPINTANENLGKEIIINNPEMHLRWRYPLMSE